jgi:hypothetical protein
MGLLQRLARRYGICASHRPWLYRWACRTCQRTRYQ